MTTPAPLTDDERVEVRRDPIGALTRLLRKIGAVPTFDDRRIKRAAREWPDCLPPMFPDGSER